VDEFGRRGHHRGFDCVHCGGPKQRSPDKNVTREAAFRLGTLERLEFAETRFQNLSTARQPTSAWDVRAFTHNADNQFACECSFQVAVTMGLQQWPDRCADCLAISETANQFQAGIGDRQPTALEMDVTSVLHQNPLRPPQQALQIYVACLALERRLHQKRQFRLQSFELRLCRLYDKAAPSLVIFESQTGGSFDKRMPMIPKKRCLPIWIAWSSM